ASPRTGLGTGNHPVSCATIGVAKRPGEKSPRPRRVFGTRTDRALPTSEVFRVSHLLLLTKSPQSSVEVLPALALLPHHVRILPAEASALIDAPQCDAVLVDGRHDLAQVRSLT